MAKMRICLAISGKLRCYKHCYPRLKQFILEPLAPDVFFYGYENKEGQDQNQKDVKELWNPVRCSIGIETPEIVEFLHHEHHNPEYDGRKAPTTNMDWFYGQYNNLAEVAKLVRKHEIKEKFRYDVVIRSRCDCFYHRTPTAEELSLAAAGNILIPHKWAFNCVQQQAKSDAWAMTDSEGFQKYSMILEKFPEYFAAGCMAHHESACGWNIDAMGLKYIGIESPVEFEFPAELSHIAEQNRHNY